MTTATPKLPMTILDLKTMGVTGAVISCEGCGRMNLIEWDALRLADDTPFPDISRLKRFACSACGSKSVGVIADWSGYKPQGGGR